MQEEIKPGKYPGIANDQYHVMPGISKSGLMMIERSVAHYLEYLKGETKSTDALDVGAATHCLVLEAVNFDRLFIRGPEARANSNEWKGFVAANADKTVLKPRDYDNLKNIRDAVWAHPTAKNILTGGEQEVSYWWNDPETGLLCKCRPDHRNHHGDIVDLKTTKDAEFFAFQKAVGNYTYHVQAAFYSDGVKAVTGEAGQFLFVAVEKEPPYGVAVYVLDDEAIKKGRDRYKHLLRTYRDYAESEDKWPGYPLDIQELWLQPWA